ncbi:hypothetical protein OS493_029271 [Desmophyllum pertusum]|uniref:Deleted in malignant brain tumors 1 protein n=1 Tax=Desmophyllum pertusum TaxID=174260 RepID=A0A9W9ZL37_9CNID|nr:hypothetical protein OS493_029271 [Desmophyllum pertusum]
MARCISWCLLSLLTILQWMSLAEASHFRAGHITWKPDSNNTLRFVFRLAFRRSYSGSYYCDEDTKSQGSLIGYGDSWNAQCHNPYNQLCSNAKHIADTGFHCTDFSVNEDWSMGENNFTVSYSSIASSHVWTVSYSSCCWISSLARYADSSWLVSTKLDLTPRSDNGKINSSPVSRSPAIFRLHEGCKQSLRIPVEDPDGDVVKCRWASKIESNIPSDSFPHGVLDEENCVLSYGGRSGTAGTYAVTLTLEDFPAGTTDFQNARPFSNVGLQFLVIISGQSGSCDDKPVFTDSTPQDGECSEVQIGSVYKAVIEHCRDNHFFPNWNANHPFELCWRDLLQECHMESNAESSRTAVVLLPGVGLEWIKKPRTSAYIRLVLQPYGHTIYKVDTLSQYVNIDNNNRTVLHFATPKAALSMNGSYAILIDNGAVVGQGCSYDGPPTPGIKSPGDWGFPVDGICPVGFSLAPPEFTNCVDINECGGHSRSKRSYYWWWQSYIAPSSSSLAYGGAAASASVPSYLSVATPTPESCFYNLTDPSGNFTSPYYPQHYSHDLDCTWIISVTPGYYIYLHFEHFHLEDGGSHCPYDYVQIFDGYSSSSSLILKRCAYQDAWCVYSNSSVLHVRFITDGSASHPGFSAYYERVHERNSSCTNAPTTRTWKILEEDGLFIKDTTQCDNNLAYRDYQCDSNLPSANYSTNTTSISPTPASTSPTASASIAPGPASVPECFNHSYLEDAERSMDFYNANYATTSTNIISPTSASTSPTASASIAPGPASVPECFNHSYLEDAERSMDFYNAQSLPAATPIPGNNFDHLNQPYGNFTSPNYPGCYPISTYWTWLIEAPIGQYIRLHFKSFHLEGKASCPWDYVEIFDGNSLSSSRMIKACGQMAPWELFSSGRFLFVRFYSDAIVRRPGFFATYQRVSYRHSVALPTQVSSTSAVQCHATHTATATATAVNGIHPTPSSGMHSSFYAASSVNVLPDPSQFELHLPSDCDQICSNTIGSYTCSCISGYQLALDGKSCSDIDECSSNNGGCSHHCFNIPGSFYCDCPEGITMGANNLTCVEPGVSVDCGDSRMTVSLEKKTFPFFDVAQLHLRYASCKATENDTHLLISTDLNGCGTLVNETQDALIFWNEIRADAVIIDFVITRTHDIRLPFYCSYSRKKLISLSFTPRRIHFGQEVGYGNFTFSMEFYKSSSYATPYALQDYPLEVQLDDYLYVQYSVESSADLVIMAENCKATKGNSHSWPQYNIIQNGCPRDTTLDYSYDPTRKFQQFKIKTFRFFNDYDTVYFHCELLACHRYSPNSRCEKSCLNGNKRKKREVTRDEVEHDESTTKITLTQGPVVIKETGQSGGKFKTFFCCIFHSAQFIPEHTDQSKQTALIGGVAGASAFGLIAAIALAVLFVKYRIARRLMNRNKVGDLYTTQDEQMSRRNAYIQEDDMIENEDAL